MSHKTKRLKAARNFAARLYLLDMDEESSQEEKSQRLAKIRIDMEDYEEKEEKQNPIFSRRRFKKLVIDTRDSLKQIELHFQTMDGNEDIDDGRK